MRKSYFIIVLPLFILVAYLFHQKIPFIIQWVQSMGIIAPLFFIMLYCVTTLLFVPTTPLVLAGGALFGPVFGVFLNLLSATLSAFCGFMMTRYLPTSWFMSKKQQHVQRMIDSIEQHGWKSVAFFRLAPVVPCSVVNYGFGLTQIKCLPYCLVTFICLIPYKVIMTYCGYAGIHFIV